MNSISQDLVRILKVVWTILTFGVPLLIDVLARKKVQRLLDDAIFVHVVARRYNNTGKVYLYLSSRVRRNKQTSVELAIDDLEIVELGGNNNDSKRNG